MIHPMQKNEGFGFHSHAFDSFQRDWVSKRENTLKWSIVPWNQSNLDFFPESQRSHEAANIAHSERASSSMPDDNSAAH